MYRSVYDFKGFYNMKIGRVARRIMQTRIQEFWPDMKDMRVMGYGYAIPYLAGMSAQAERVFSVMPAGQGAHIWPQTAEEKNLVCVAEEVELPLESNSVDRILLMHSLEFSEMLQPHLQEISRVLKANGKILAIVPNRGGLWAQADWTPFGRGTPYSAGQIAYYLTDNGFVHERTEGALYMPPVKSSLIFKSAGIIERFGQRFMPFGAGVHMVEATKQIYARVGPDGGSKVTVRGRTFMPRPVPLGRQSG